MSDLPPCPKHTFHFWDVTRGETLFVTLPCACDRTAVVLIGPVQPVEFREPTRETTHEYCRDCGTLLTDNDNMSVCRRCELEDYRDPVDPKR